jgi:hypothetical protein
MKTRIVLKITKDGKETYITQKKGSDVSWFIYAIPIFGWTFFIVDFLFWENLNDDIFGRNNFYSLEKAKLAIDKYLQDISHEKEKEENGRIVKKIYFKHP